MENESMQLHGLTKTKKGFVGKCLLILLSGIQKEDGKPPVSFLKFICPQAKGITTFAQFE
jgi:hypothetical protein